jgi:aminoglycoside phosphotransferase (APT) family kinase protein
VRSLHDDIQATAERTARPRTGALDADSSGAAVASGASERDPVLVHGDLSARHLYVEREAGPGRRACVALTGIIDWGDVHLGDRAVDLSVAIALFPAVARSRFTDAYGSISAGTWARARFRAIQHASTTTLYAAGRGDHAWLRESQGSLGRVLE